MSKSGIYVWRWPENGPKLVTQQTWLCPACRNCSKYIYFFVICTYHRLSFGPSRERGWSRWNLWLQWDRREKHTGFWWGILKGIDRFEDLSVDRKIILNIKGNLISFPYLIKIRLFWQLIRKWKAYRLQIQSDQKVSVHMTITVQKTGKNAVF